MAKKTKAELRALIKKKEAELEKLEEMLDEKSGETYGDPVVTLH